MDDTPYTVVAVDLDEGARIYGRLLGDVGPDAGARVRFHPFHVKVESDAGETEAYNLVGFSIID
jgi:uncharacterized OB-fold protein